MKLGLQIVLGLFSLIPLAFAVMGMAHGAAGLDPGGQVAGAVDNQFRYLSGMYAVVTLLLWSIIPEIEKHFRTAAIICAALFVGGALQKAFDPQQVIGLLSGWHLPGLLVWPALAYNAAAGLALAFGVAVRPLALSLSLYCVVTSAFHFLPGDPWQMTIFVKNWAIAGGCLALAVAGSGRIAVRLD